MADTPIKIFGDGSATRDYLYVEDLCRGIVLALDAQFEGFNVLHLAAGNEVSVNRLAKTICDVAGRPNHPIEYFDKRPGEVDRNFADFSLAKNVLGFFPEHTLTQALEKTFAWYENYKQLY